VSTDPNDLKLPVSYRGATFSEIHDRSRTDTQYEAVWRVMLDGQKHQLEELQSRIFSVFGVRATTGGINARIRDFRKPECGGHTVHETRIEGLESVHEYQLEVNPHAQYTIARYHFMNERGAEAAKHDKPLADFLVRIFKQSLDQLPSRPRNAKGFTKAIRDEVLAAIEKHLDTEAASAGWSKTLAAANADLVGFGDEQRIEI